MIKDESLKVGEVGELQKLPKLTVGYFVVGEVKEKHVIRKHWVCEGHHDSIAGKVEGVKSGANAFYLIIVTQIQVPDRCIFAAFYDVTVRLDVDVG